MAEIIRYIIPSIIGAGGMIIVQAIIASKQQRIQDVKNEYVIKEIKADIQRLETKQDKHNSLIERFAVLERDLKTAWNTIDDLKAELKETEKEIHK